jgi:NADH-quinone oxidoreductase subunit L
VIGAVIAVAGIAVAYRIWFAEPGIATRLRERLPAVHRFLFNKWYFDELIDLLFVRPALMFGRLAEALERIVVAGGVTGGTVGAIRAGSAAVRRAQTGFLRYYAALMVVGVFGVGLYFLVSSS